MSKSVPMRPRLAPKATLSFAIVASQYNAQFTQPLVDNAYQELNILEPGATVSLISAPGSFELPLMVQAVAELDRYQAIIALGLIIQGDQDQVVPLEPMQKLVDKLSRQRDIKVDYRIIKGADHFFQSQLEELGSTVEDYIANAKPKRATGR